MHYLPNIIFAICCLGAFGLFSRNIIRIRKNILKGKKLHRSDQANRRWKNMFLVAIGQTKMVRRPVAGILHILVYVGFVIINIELVEIILDGLLGTHRLFSSFLGALYTVLIASFEVLALGVLVAVLFFWTRRNITRIKRFWAPEMKGWPKKDGNFILYYEVVLMLLFLGMNATDALLQSRAIDPYIQAGAFPISQWLQPLFTQLSTPHLILLERTFWWAHILGIFSFLNYLYYSKHLHILLAFPNTYYANLQPKGKFAVNGAITHEVQLMFDPSTVASSDTSAVPEKFGASEVYDLNWVQLMNAYSCTECGRCTSVCPANLTGKKLSPRKIMMDTRDRMEELERRTPADKGGEVSDGKQLLGDYITPEEIWACTSCNACVEACPIEIDPLSIIMDLRQFLVMEQSAAPNALNSMMSNIENNGAPWPFNNQDRLLWAQEN